MKKSELLQLIKEELGNKYPKPKSVSRVDSTSKEKKFLQLFNWQPFDDWYKQYEDYVSGEDMDKQFYEETKEIIEWLSQILKKSKS